MVAAQLTGGVAVFCCLSVGSSKWEFHQETQQGFLVFLQGGEILLAYVLRPWTGQKGSCLVQLFGRRESSFFQDSIASLNSESGLQSSDVEETCDPSNPSVGLKYEFFLLPVI
ncbi:UNVERIFIED_CONTAM: hypothetical protein Sradi_2780300 [Sesamum radiatum]|uniref:Uncharacterized protein n=1 Tax=Sesamum radiatum TaxID=300843 RepID=A0AAW2RUJ6_SESRA